MLFTLARMWSNTGQKGTLIMQSLELRISVDQ